MKKMVVPIVLIIVISALMIVLVLPAVNLTSLDQASTEAVIIDNMLAVEAILIIVVFVMCMVFFFYSIFYWRSAPGKENDVITVKHNTGLEVTWTVIPLILVVGLAVYATPIFDELIETENADMTVDVTGSQWSWSFYYPEEEITSDVLALPEGKRILLNLESVDVIHSFWVPEFRVKQDAVPGVPTTLVITPTQIGRFEVRCAELCGQDHYNMIRTVEVMNQADYDTWIAQNSTKSDDPVERGMQVAEEFGCTACHSVDGSETIGPTWLGLYGSEEALADGTTIVVDDEYLITSIYDPQADIVAGFEDKATMMPTNFEGRIDPEKLDDLIAYIMSLGE